MRARPGRPAPLPLIDEIYQRFQAYQQQLASRNGLRHGVLLTPMVSRDGRVFAFVVQETGRDTSFIEVHDGVSVRRFPLLDDHHQVTATRWIAECRTCACYDAAMGPGGEVYRIRNVDGTGRLYNQTTDQVLTTGPADYSWPAVQ